MKKQKKTKKLSLKKLQMAKINNLNKVYGGTKHGGFQDGDLGDCLFPENASKPKDDSIRL